MDDFHHALHVLLTGERSGYYEGYAGAHDLARSYREGFVYAGQYATIRRRRHGRAAHDVPPCRFVVCAQNHDQIGNRMMGDRLAASLDGERLKLAAAAVVLSPFIPLLFMGEEYGDPAPFPYFVIHHEEALEQAVREGRAQEFDQLDWQGQQPEPQTVDTFESAMLNPQHREHPPNAALYALYGRLFELRTALFGGAATQPGTVRADVVASDSTIAVVRPGLACDSALLLNFTSDSTEVALTTLGVDAGVWHVLLDTSDAEWAGPRAGLAGRDVGGTDRVALGPWSALLLRA
jgi:maltooligosyltrehalose trehalohydrolase